MCRGQDLKVPQSEDCQASEPKKSDQCQIYHVHQDGLQCHQFLVNWGDVIKEIDPEAQRDSEFCSDHRLTLMYEYELRFGFNS